MYRNDISYWLSHVFFISKILKFLDLSLKKEKKNIAKNSNCAKMTFMSTYIRRKQHGTLTSFSRLTYFKLVHFYVNNFYIIKKNLCLYNIVKTC